MEIFYRWQRWWLELVFWLPVFSIGLALGFFYIVQERLSDQLYAEPLRSDWTVLDRQGNILTDNISLPLDFAKLPQAQTHRAWVLTKSLSTKVFMPYDQPMMVLGRIADSDRVSVGICDIGSTGLSRDNEAQGWWWGALRAYKVPKMCFSDADAVQIRVQLYKWGGPYQGIYTGPIGLGEYDQIQGLVRLVEWLRFDILTIFGGIFLIGLMFYHAFVFFLLPQRVYNGIFALVALGIGIYEIILGALPYRFFDDITAIMKINFMVAIVTSLLLLVFLHNRLNCLSLKVVKTAVVSGLCILLLGVFQTSMDAVYQFYQLWFAGIILFFSIAYIQFIQWLRHHYTTVTLRYAIGFSLFMAAIVADIVATVFGVALIYMVPYGFVAFVGAVSFALAEEYSEAFKNVEDQVALRTVDLGQALDRLRTMEKMKERFYANMSHDFKTPIAVALGSLDEVKDSHQRQDQVGHDRAIVSAQSSLEHLLRMIADMLDTLKAETGVLHLTWQVAPIANLLNEWLESSAVLCRRRNIQLNWETSGYEHLHIPMDRNRMQRVVENLLNNAIKFTASETSRRRQIRVSLHTDEACVHIVVEDSGIGIPQSEKGQVFTRYFQSSRTSLQEHGGSGIGLSYVQEIVALHNGRISLTDSELGGTKFSIALPLSQDIDVVVPYDQREVTGEGQLGVRGSLDVAYPPQIPDDFQANRLSILLAEDNPEVAQISVRALSDQYNVYFAPDGEVAWGLLQKHVFACVVTDIVMPRMPGDVLLKKMRSEHRFQAMPIVILSSHGDEETVIRLLEQGANDYVIKPFRREILRARVRSQIHTAQTALWISQNEKIIELGFLASGMAHQIRNGLNSLRNQVSFQQRMADNFVEDLAHVSAEKITKAQQQLVKSAEMIQRAVTRIEQLTHSIDTYASGSTERVEIKVADSIELARTLHEDKLKKKTVALEVRGLDSLKILGYSSFHEVWVNLVGNAIDACASDGTGKIMVSGECHNGYIVVRVKDNGQGIDPRHLSLIFQPFFTTKRPGEGTGLGLYIARDIIQIQHGGHFEIVSEGIGLGSQCTVRVPIEAPVRVDQAKISIHGVQI